MAQQLHLWGDQDEKSEPVGEESHVDYPTPPEPPPQPAPNPSRLDRDLELLNLDCLGQSAQRIATAVEYNQDERRAEFIRMINYEVAVGKLSREQRDLLQKIVWGQYRYT